MTATDTPPSWITPQPLPGQDAIQDFLEQLYRGFQDLRAGFVSQDPVRVASLNIVAGPQSACLTFGFDGGFADLDIGLDARGTLSGKGSWPLRNTGRGAAYIDMSWAHFPMDGLVLPVFTRPTMIAVRAHDAAWSSGITSSSGAYLTCGFGSLPRRFISLEGETLMDLLGNQRLVMVPGDVFVFSSAHARLMNMTRRAEIHAVLEAHGVTLPAPAAPLFVSCNARQVSVGAYKNMSTRTDRGARGVWPVLSIAR